MEGRGDVSRRNTSGLGFADGILTVQGNNEEKKAAMGFSNPSNSAGPSCDARIGLELGKRTYFEVPGSVSSSNAQSLTKKSRSSSQVPKCQVEECTTDLSSAKDYHRRHKVCPAHSKTPRVIVGGREQRFCQQCSRFHSLTEFDEGKRSCRRRLAGHNERRRKPQPDPMSLHARYLPAFQESLRLRHLYADQPYLPVRIPGVTSIWEEYNTLKANEQKSTWPSRIFKHEDQSTFPLSSRTGIEQQLLLSGYQQQNDKSSVFPPQSPNCTFSVKSDVSGSKTHHHFQESVSPLCQGLTLTASSRAGVLSGLEAVPVGQGFIRVSDSGRALSLQSTMQLGFSTQASVAESLDSTLSVISENASDKNNIPIAEPIKQRNLNFGWMNDKLVSTAASNLQCPSSIIGCPSGGSSIVDKNNSSEETHFHVMNGVGNYESNALYSMFHEDVQGGSAAEDVKPTMDLMHSASTSASHSSQAVLSTGSYDMESTDFGDLQAVRSYGFSIFNSHQM